MSYTKGEWHLDALTGEIRANGGRITKVYGATEFKREKMLMSAWGTLV